MKRSDAMRISLIIPAYNEEERIGDVLTAAKNAHVIDQIIVINDGSEDETARVARDHGVTVIDLPDNRGKGFAMQRGIEHAEGTDVFVFSDADIMGIKAGHFIQLIQPLLDDNSLMMTVGKFVGGRLRTDLSQNLLPSISGQRAIRSNVMEQMEDLSSSRFGAEIMISRRAKRTGAKTLEVVLNDLTHVMKEEKLGFRRGFWARMQMYQEMLRSFMREKKGT